MTASQKTLAEMLDIARPDEPLSSAQVGLAPARLSPALALLLALLSTAGCSSESGPTAFPVTGSVIVNGQPAPYAKLTFHPTREDQQELWVYAKADENGEFSMLFPLAEDGEEAMEYTVAISWRIPENPRDRNDPNYGEELLPKKFQDHKQSGLKIEIDPSVEELEPFELNL